MKYVFFKHERLALERRLGGTPQDDCASSTSGLVNTSDIARLMEMFQVRSLVLRMERQVDLFGSQSSLLKYRDFEPFDDEDVHSDVTHFEPHSHQRNQNHARSKSFWERVRSHKRLKSTDKGKEKGSAPFREPSTISDSPRRQFSHKKEERAEKKVPVIFFDEAHKL